MTDQARNTDDRDAPAEGGDPALDEATRSEAACPRCGAHRLALLNLPTIDTTGYRPLDELYGMTGGPNLRPPGIGCLACGAEWPDLAAFKAAQEGGSDPTAGA